MYMTGITRFKLTAKHSHYSDFSPSHRNLSTVSVVWDVVGWNESKRVNNVKATTIKVKWMLESQSMIDDISPLMEDVIHNLHNYSNFQGYTEPNTIISVECF